ncbi:MAG: hypothetical protein MUC57_14695, partial [Desulfobacterales bacterium]|nr:hypothetical protein [Desulfobacterales bacterium]
MSRFRVKLCMVVLVWVVMGFGCTTDSERKQGHYEKAQGYIEKGEYKSAKIELKNAIQLDGKFVGAH